MEVGKKLEDYETEFYIDSGPWGRWEKVRFRNIKEGDIVRAKMRQFDGAFVALSDAYFDAGLGQWAVDRRVDRI